MNLRGCTTQFPTSKHAGGGAQNLVYFNIFSLAPFAPDYQFQSQEPDFQKKISCLQFWLIIHGFMNLQNRNPIINLKSIAKLSSSCSSSQI